MGWRSLESRINGGGVGDSLTYLARDAGDPPADDTTLWVCAQLLQPICHAFSAPYDPREQGAEERPMPHPALHVFVQIIFIE